MHRHTLLPLIFVAMLVSVAVGGEDEITQGSLRARGPEGGIIECPLRHTAYQAEISGMVARVEVVQTFVNPFPQPIEAVYVFPLSHESGVVSMTLEVGGRRLVGALLKRADASAVYQAARAAGRTASLLDQERPNVFTQTVGNIPPGGEVKVRLAYVECLAFDSGAYEFHLPLVVGPRYLPGAAVSGTAVQDASLAGTTVPVQVPAGVGRPTGTGWSPDTDRVSDASRISPPVLRPGFRSGHEVSIAVDLAAGLAIRDLASANHRVAIERTSPASARIRLDPADALPNKDFVLRYAVAGEAPELGAVAHVGADGGWLQLTLMPAVLASELSGRRPRDLCFLIDVSGSMQGAPLAKAKEAMRAMLLLAGPQDRLQVIAFASGTARLFPDYQPVRPETVAQAIAFIDGQRVGGGTEMLAGVRAVLDQPVDDGRMRMAVMLTDGYIGSEKEIIAAVGTRGCDSIRFWCIGIGASPNRYLIDGVAAAGGGMGVVLGLADDSQQAVDGLMRRIQSAQLDRLRLDWGGLPVTEVVPQCLPPLWPGRPVMVCGRFAGPASGIVTMHGEIEGRAVAIPLRVELPAHQPGNGALRTLWARQRIGELRRRETVGDGYDLAGAITDLSLAYGVMTEFTSFVAVDEAVVNPGGAVRPVNVAVPLPVGVGLSALPVVTNAQIPMPVGREEAIGDMEAGSQGLFLSIGAGGPVGAFSYRAGGGRRRAMSAGGTRSSVSAVDAGLRFLKSHQGMEGAWSPTLYPVRCATAPRCEPGLQGDADDTVAVTAQALLGFLGAGYDHRTPSRYRQTVAVGLVWLQARQQADGTCAATVEGQAQAASVMADAYGQTGDPVMLKPAQAALDRLLRMRLPGGDGLPLAWGEASAIDTMATALAVQALAAGQKAGLSVGDGLTRARQWLDDAWRSANPGWTATGSAIVGFPACWSPAGSATGSAIEAAAHAAALLGWLPGDPRFIALGMAIDAGGPAALAGDLRRLAWAHQAQFSLGGGLWSRWNPRAQDMILKAQIRTGGCSDGSWDAQGQCGPDGRRGRLQSTALAIRMLETYYAYDLGAKRPATSAPAGP